MFLSQIINYGIFAILNVFVAASVAKNGTQDLPDISPVFQILLMLSLVLCIGSTIMVRIKFMESKASKYVFAAGGILWNIVGINVTGFSDSYAACFVIMTMITVYVDLKLTMAVNGTLGGYLLIIGIRDFATGNLDMMRFGMAFLTIVLIMLGSCLITKLFIVFFREQVEDINAQNENQKVLINTVSVASEQVLSKYDIVMNGLSEITEQTEQNRLTMHGIADDMRANAKDIQNQVLSTNEIQTKIKEAETTAEKVEHAVNEVFTDIVDGLKNADSLAIEAKSVDDKTKEMSESISLLSNRVKDVTGFVETILSISQQTNLLALNASIEAARAGEAGRGFAVVADQIRLLSENTKDATTQITQIIQELEGTTDNTQNILEASIAHIHANSERAIEVNRNFTNTGKNIDLLKALVDDISHDIKMIHDSNKIIVSSVTQLSDVSKGVTTAAHTGEESNDRIIQSMNWLNLNMNEILEEITNLEALTKTNQ